MKAYKKIFLTLFAISIISLSANAQKGILKFDLNYNYSMPLSGFKSDLVKDASPRGVRAGIFYSFDDRLSAGLESGFQDYYQKTPRALYSIGKSQAVSAVLTNSIQTMPFLLKAKYLWTQAGSIRPYVSVGAGANMIDYHQYLGQFGSSKTNIGFLAEGGVGLKVPFGKTSASGIDVGATYDFAPYKKYGFKDLNTFNVKAGIYFKLD
jgi:hypothetical protein